MNAELISNYSALAKEFRLQGDRAADAWLESFAPHENAGFLLAFHGEKLVKNWLTFRNGAHIVPKHLRAAYCGVDRLMLHRLVQAAQARMSNTPSQHFVAAMLSAAPEELRDVDLALEMARRSVELAADDEAARESLAWALFRSGQWQACVDALPQADALVSGKFGEDDGPHSILAMALWKLGRRAEALALYEHAAERLEAWERLERDAESKGKTVLPPTSWLKRLHKEAVGMLETEGSPEDGANGKQSTVADAPAS